MALTAWKSFSLEELGLEKGDRSCQNVEAIVVVQGFCESNKSRKALVSTGPAYRTATVPVLLP